MRPEPEPLAPDADAGTRACDAQRLEQRFHYTYASPIRDLRHRLVTIPPARHGRQVRLGHGVHVVGDPVLVSTSRDGFGNHVVDVRAAVVRAWIEMCSWSVVAFEERGGPTTTASMAARLTRPTLLTGAGEQITDAAFAARAASGKDDLQLAERLCAWTHGALRYEYGTTHVGTTADEALAGGVGVCQDSAHVMIAACRRVGLAARYVSGHLAGEGGSHAWVEVLVPRRGGAGTGDGRFEAIAFDPTHDRRVEGSGYVTVAVGRDYHDVAPTSGSFSGRCCGVLAASKALRPA